MLAQELFGLMQCLILSWVLDAFSLTINRPDDNKLLHLVLQRPPQSAASLSQRGENITARGFGFLFTIEKTPMH
jgi:hypothetical protein